MITGLDYFYDAQMRRFLEQIVRAASGFQYQTGNVGGGAPQMRMVPARMATTDRMAANIIKNGSDNALLTVPMLCVYMTDLRGRRGDVQNLDHVDTLQVTERKIDAVTGKYTNEIGRRYTVQRLMPRPFEMMVNVDLWTSNQDQKHQLVEQIMTIFFPDITIQNSDNGLDWTAMTTMQVDDIVWSSRSIPIGTENEIDVMTMRLKLPFWLSPPAKVMQQKIIRQIVTNIEQGDLDADGILDNVSELAQAVTTPGGHSVKVAGNKITLLGPRGALHDPSGALYDWASLFQLYGDLRPTLSQLRLKTNPDLDDDTYDLIGTIEIDSIHPNELFWSLDPDTLPANTKPPVLAVIDPRKSWPDNGLPAAAEGQRYLVIHALTPGGAIWGNFGCNQNDIIQYVNGQWTVAFRPSAHPTTPDYLVNQHSGRQLRWNGFDWVLTIDGEYTAGFWRLRL